jgi:branched-chain amino acid transport system ATP-binding protein
MLCVRDLHAYYGKSHVLQGLDLDVGPGEVVALLGRNGSGRSTLAKALTGAVRAHGSAKFKGVELLGLPAHAIARHGVGYVPENRDIFPTLTVRQNLLLGIRDPKHPPRWGMDEMLRRFPQLSARADVAAGVLSGGEQQILSICRTLLGEPALLIVDEPTEGLAPRIVQEIGGLLGEVRAQGMAVLLIEQKLMIALEVSSRAYLLGHGRVVFEGPPAALVADAALRREWLEV